MKLYKEILNLIGKYSFNESLVNRLIVSTFCQLNSISVKNNILIKSLLIDERDTDEYQKLLDLIDLFNGENQHCDFELLITLFEFVISPSDKIVNGAIYTPSNIRQFIINSSLKNEDLSNKTFCDVACGCGGFLFDVAKLLYSSGIKFKNIYERNLFGIDIKKYSINRTKILLCLLAITHGEDEKEFNFNFYVGNSLSFNWQESSDIFKRIDGFDYIFSNPPYVGSTNIDEDSKALLKNWSVASTGKADLYIPFFELGLKWLNENGSLGYITVNTFYKSLNGRALRSYFSEKEYSFKIIDFGSEQIFNDRLTYTCICLIEKKEGEILYAKSKLGNLSKLSSNSFYSIKYEQLNDKDGWLLDDYITQVNIRKIENIGDSLGNLFNIRNGFATLKNDVFLFKAMEENETHYKFVKDNVEYTVEKAACRDAIKPNVLKKEEEIPILKEKIIFPYKIDSECKTVSIIPKSEFKEKYPDTYFYLSNYKSELDLRDKGQRDYPEWFSFGRTQALNIRGKKLLFPYISNMPYFVYTDDEDLMFYNGYAIISNSFDDLMFLKKILTSDMFWYYIENTSKPYSNNYFSLAKNYVKNFGIPSFNEKERKKLLKLKSKKAINAFLEKKYDVYL
ncbi:HsdM family class I SAM-dependent methyltransferase [Chryseobacterium gleum]|uniref:HsdM family class I SAM-dependent methyltransferase n=1 Tax=Chryseobacterium gleum TaxID=250 RepID=UPI00241D0225|nr:N-6 DNA methylase [Chryseobacterium gleum]